MNLEEKIKGSNKIITTVINSMDRLCGGFSGGKDSVVVHHLVRQINSDIPFYYANTTIDPAGTVPFIRNNFPDVMILNPKESFYQLIKRKGLPTRLNRYCCEYLKEYVGIGKNMFEGVRSAESKNRQGRDYIQCDSRKSYKGGQHIYPIYDWTDEDVWEYIEHYNLPIAPSYKKAGGCMDRLGCVGCPLVSRKGARQSEFDVYPKYFDATKRAIGIGMANNPQWKLSKLTGGDSELAMKWWLTGKTMNEYFGDPTIPTLFSDYE